MPYFDNNNGVLRDRIAQPITSLTKRNKQIPKLGIINFHNRAANQRICLQVSGGLQQPLRGAFRCGRVVRSEKFTQPSQISDGVWQPA